MCRSCAAVVLLFALWSAAPAAQPDRTAALDKAKTKFEADVARSEEALVKEIDKALGRAAGNKMLLEKLTYERDMFLKHRLTPTEVPVPTAVYVRQRAQSIATLEAAYRPVIKELTKAKKEEDAEALETALSNLVKSARGYGLAVPDLEGRPPLYIVNKGTGLVLELKDRDVTLGTKAPDRKGQLWHLDREERGFVFRNLTHNEVLYPTFRGDPSGAPKSFMVVQPFDPKKDTPERALFELNEVRLDVLITGTGKGIAGKGGAGDVLTATERKLKGVTVYDLGLEKKESPPGGNQLWTITRAR